MAAREHHGEQWGLDVNDRGVGDRYKRGWLLVSKPLRPPFRDGTSVLARTLVQALPVDRKLVYLGDPDRPVRVAPHDVVIARAAMGYEPGLLQKLGLLVPMFDRRWRGLGLHFFFTPNATTSRVLTWIRRLQPQRPMVQTLTSADGAERFVAELACLDRVVVQSDATRERLIAAGLDAAKIVRIHPTPADPDPGSLANAVVRGVGHVAAEAVVSPLAHGQWAGRRSENHAVAGRSARAAWEAEAGLWGGGSEADPGNGPELGNESNESKPVSEPDPGVSGGAPERDEGLGERPVLLYAGDLDTAVVDRLQWVVHALERSDWSACRLVVACRVKGPGAAAARRRLGSIVQSSSARERIELLGEVTDMPALLRRTAIQLFVADHVRRKVDIPLVLLEGLGHGVPVVTLPVASVSELHAAGHAHGLEPGAVTPDMPSMLLRIEAALREPSTLARWRRDARAVALACFSTSTMAEAHEGLYAAFDPPSASPWRAST